MTASGKLITIEGIDGTGKTTLASRMSVTLAHRRIDVRLLREPGGVELSEQLRSLVKDPALRVGARAEALIYAAARAQLTDEAIRPLLAAGTWVLLDRFIDSSLAYQGAGRDLGVPEIRVLNAFATGGLVPDRTLLLMLDTDAARARAVGRTTDLDRLEQEGRDFFERVQQAYAELARTDPERISTLDAAQPPDALHEMAMAAIEDLIAEGQ